MKIIHTSDWHIGACSGAFRRFDEFRAFFRFLLETVRKTAADALVVSGDVFNDGTPGVQAQELYYDFLAELPDTSCRSVVIAAGNHDSAAFLEAPAGLLKRLNCRIFGTYSPESECVFPLKDSEGKTGAVVCAIPYLRSRDVLDFVPGESSAELNSRMVKAVRDCYSKAAEQAEKLRAASGGNIPVIAMGHLFAAGGKKFEGDGTEDLCVGTLFQVGADCFPETFDYVALGHLHSPQTVAGENRIRYSGSPLVMSVAEPAGPKQVILVEFHGRTPEITPIPVPCSVPQKLFRGTLAESSAFLRSVLERKERIRIQFECTDGSSADFARELYAPASGSCAEILAVRALRSAAALSGEDDPRPLSELKETEVFDRLLELRGVPEEERPALRDAFRGILQSVRESGSAAAGKEQAQ